MLLFQVKAALHSSRGRRAPRHRGRKDLGVLLLAAVFV